MHLSAKKIGGLAFGGIVLFVMLALFVCLPSTVFGAEAKPLGEEEPFIYCTYYDESGNQVDGNTLTAGTYTVNFELSGVSTISVIQFTATYTDAVTVAETPLSLISDTNSELSSMGYILQNGNIVFGFVSNNDDNTAITGDTVVLASISVSFSADCDAADVIQFSSNANLTFAEVDYSHGYNDCYAPSETDYTVGTVHPMLTDASRSLGVSVSGSIVIMTNGSGDTNGISPEGEYTINVYKDEALTNLVTSAVSSSSVDDNNKIINNFIINDLQPGTYYAEVTSKYAITRNNIQLVVGSTGISECTVPMIVCDYNSDGNVSALDGVFIAKAVGTSTPGMDLNGDRAISGLDNVIIAKCTGVSEYSALIIQ